MNSQKVNASAMYYALFLSLIFGLLLGGLILMSSFNQQFVLKMDLEEKLVNNAYSGIAYGQVYFNELEPKQTSTIELFGEGMDSVELELENWGAFKLIKSTAKHHGSSFTKTALLGSEAEENIPNLYLTDNGRQVTLCGDTRIEGICEVPKSGFKRGYIEGKNYTGSQFVYGKSTPSSKMMPPLQDGFIAKLFEVSGEFMPWNPDVDTFKNPFTEPAQHYVSDNFIDLTEKQISGHIIIEAKDSILISSTTQLEHVILKSKRIIIEEGFSGTAQFLASEEICISENVLMRYPSIIALVERSFPQDQAAEITIGQNSQIIGSIFLVSEAPNFRLEPRLKIAKYAEVDGIIYNTGATELKGIIKGHLLTSKFFLKTASSAYENHVLDGQILDQLPTEFVTANLFKSTKKLTVIAWL